MDLLVLTDTPTIELDDAGKPVSSFIQIAKTGVFQDPRYGKFSITQRDFSKWIANFNLLAKSNGRIGLPLDVDHSPEKQGVTEAAGWITALQVRGDELWAKVEWTSLGVELVKDRRYAYISPSYQHNYRDETGKQHGTALVGAALTNRPFLSMATVSLSKDFTVAVELDETVIESEEHEMPLKDIAAKLSLAEDADEATILAKVDELLKPPTQAQGDSVNLAQLAQEQGLTLLTADEKQKLLDGIAAGEAAKRELKDAKFLNAFNAAVEGGKAVPAQQEHFRKLYDLDADTTLDVMSKLPKVLNTELQGHGGDGSASVDPEFTGARVDEDRAALDARAQVLMREHKIDYADAVMLAAQEGLIAMAFARILNGHEWALPAASAINPYTPVQLAGSDTPFYLPIGTNNVRPYGVSGVGTAGASGLNQGEALTVYEPGNIVKVIAAASCGVGAEVGVASTNGAVSPAALVSASGHWALGLSVSAAGAGEVLSILIAPRKV